MAFDNDSMTAYPPGVAWGAVQRCCRDLKVACVLRSRLPELLLAMTLLFGSNFHWGGCQCKKVSTEGRVTEQALVMRLAEEAAMPNVS
jgi:hypothetical protein